MRRFKPFSGLQTFRWVLGRGRGSKGLRRAENGSQALSELLVQEERLRTRQELIARAQSRVLANLPEIKETRGCVNVDTSGRRQRG